MAIDQQTEGRIISVSRMLLQEKKSLSVSDVTEYLQVTDGMTVNQNDVEESLQRLFHPGGSNLPPLELDQVFLFANAALGYWRSHYMVIILGVREFTTRDQGVDRKRENGFRFFCKAEGMRARDLGWSPDLLTLTQYLHSYEIDIPLWHPIYSDELTKEPVVGVTQPPRSKAVRA